MLQLLLQLLIEIVQRSGFPLGIEVSLLQRGDSLLLVSLLRHIFPQVSLQLAALVLTLEELSLGLVQVILQFSDLRGKLCHASLPWAQLARLYYQLIKLLIRVHNLRLIGDTLMIRAKIKGGWIYINITTLIQQSKF